jgi:hypothetical protein
MRADQPKHFITANHPRNDARVQSRVHRIPDKHNAPENFRNAPVIDRYARNRSTRIHTNRVSLSVFHGTLEFRQIYVIIEKLILYLEKIFFYIILKKIVFKLILIQSNH